MFWRAIILVLGVYACSTAVIMVKASTVHPVLLSSYRLLVAVAALSPLFVRELRAHRETFGPPKLKRTILPGLILGGHFISWIAGARMTLAANSSLIVNMVPIAMPLLMWLMVRERLTRGELAGTVLAVAGLAVLAGSDYRFDPVHFRGDLLCFGSMLLFAVYLALGRRNRDFPSLWLYVVPVYLIGGLFCFAVSLAFVSPLAVHGWRNVGAVIGLGIVPTVFGHSILNYSMKHLRGQSVGLANLGQFGFAGIMGFFLLGEAPKWSFYVASPLVVAGAVVALLSDPRPVPAPQLKHYPAPAIEQEGQPPCLRPPKD